MEYKCNICDKNYMSYQSLWNHNHKFHNINTTIHPQKPTNLSQKSTKNHKSDNSVTNINCTCEYCNKVLSRIDSLNRHLIICKKKLENNNKIEAKINELEKEIIQLKKDNKKPTTKIINKVQGNLINGNNHDSGPKQIIYKTGTENMDLLNYNEVSTIFDNEISSVIKLIELVNFSENKPENHSFCSTALESPYLSFYNTDTNSINKERKRHFFEEVICKSIQNHEILYKKFKLKFNLEKRRQIEDNIQNLKMIKDNSFNSKIMSEFIRKLNLISYNNRDLIQDTWTGSNGKKYEHDSDEEFMAILLDDPETQKIIEANKNTNNDIDIDSDSDDESRPQLVFASNKTKNKNIDL